MVECCPHGGQSTNSREGVSIRAAAGACWLIFSKTPPSRSMAKLKGGKSASYRDLFAIGRIHEWMIPFHHGACCLAGSPKGQETRCSLESIKLGAS